MGQWFGNLPLAMFTLFQIMTLEGCNDIGRELLDGGHIHMLVLIILFILICNFAIMNTVLAVIVEHTLSEAIEQKEQAVLRAQNELLQVANDFIVIFKSGDSDKSGQLS